ncbi:MAG TPA: 6-phosphogluconolactonase, partial [Longimicrobiales bacterium]|nr:6-phosphogluconolactonase [Longimicrobiales bacterium]
MSGRAKDADRVLVLRDGAALAERAAELFLERARAAVARHGRFSVAMAGGRTPVPTYQRLTEPEYRDRVPWQQVHVFWGDERCVPPDDPRSNEGMVRHTLLDGVPVPESQVHPVRCAGDPAAAARDYEAALRAHFGDTPRFDLVLLGLGTNGHTASLFPGTAVLRERRRWAADVRPGEEPVTRVTLTLPVLQQAACVAFLVSGRPRRRSCGGCSSPVT